LRTNNIFLRKRCLCATIRYLCNQNKRDNGLLRDLAGAVGGDKKDVLQNVNILIQFEKE